jgi:ribonuclease-3
MNGVKREKVFHYDIYEDNGIDGTRFFGIEIGIDGKVIAKESYLKSRRKKHLTHLFAMQEKNGQK